MTNSLRIPNSKLIKKFQTNYTVLENKFQHVNVLILLGSIVKLELMVNET